MFCFFWASICQGQIPEIEGRWKVVERYPKVNSISKYFTFSDGELKGGLLKSYYRIDSTKTPKEIDFTLTQRERGIYKIEGNKLTICKASANGKRPHSFDRERHRDEGWRTTVYENISEKIDPDIASFIGEWVPLKATNVPFRLIDKIVFSEPQKFEDRFGASILGWPQRKVGDPKALAVIKLQLDSSKHPPELTAYLTTQIGPQQISLDFKGTYEINNDHLKLVMISEGKPRLVHGIPVHSTPTKWYFELKKH